MPQTSSEQPEVRRRGRPRKLSPKVEAELAELAASGRTTEELADQYGLDPTTVRAIRRRHQVPPPPKRRPAPRPPMSASKVERLLSAKGTREDIARRNGISVWTLRKIREQHRTEPKRTTTRLTPELRLEIAHAAGRSTEVAAQYGCCFSTVCRLRRKYGV